MTDPYAEFGGAAVAPAPPDPYAEFGGAAATATPPPPTGPTPIEDPGGVLQNKPFPAQVKTAVEQTKGFVKGGMSTLAGMLEMGNTPMIPELVEGNPADQVEPHVKRFTDWLRAHSQINNPDQEIGNFVESAHEFLPLMGEGASNAAEKYLSKTDLAKFATKYPKLAALWNSSMVNVARTMGAPVGRVAATALRTGAETAAQTGLKTGGDAEKTEEAFKTGTELGGVSQILGEIVPTAARKIGNVISDTIERLRPGSRTVAGAEFETQPGSFDLLLRNAKDVAQDPATQAVDEALGHIGRTGVINSLNRSAAERAPESALIPETRRLPGQTGFKVGPAAEPTRIEEGQTAFEPGKQQTGHTVVEGKGPGKFNLPEYSPELADAAAEDAAKAGTLGAPNPQPEPQGSHREPTWQYRNAVRPGSPDVATDNMSGPGVLILTDQDGALSPQRARQFASRYEQVMNDPDQWNDLGVREQQRIQLAHQDITDQLSRYDDFAASQPHFEPPNVTGAVMNTNSLSDAAAQLKGEHGQFWQAADKASGGEFSALRDEEKRLQKQIFGANPTGRLDELRQQLKDVQQRQMDFFDRYKTTVSPQEWDTARSGYQDGIVLQNLDGMLQRKFGGITRAEEARGVGQRIFSPGKNFNQELEDFYNDGFRNSATNREVLERTIGRQHMDDLKKIGVLFDGAERMDSTKSLYQNIISTVSRHYHGVKGMLAAGAGATELAAHGMGKVAGVAGVPLITGTMGGIRRTLTDRLISDPEYLKSFSYALKNKIPPRTAAPLLAARLIAAIQNESLQKKKPPPTGEK